MKQNNTSVFFQREVLYEIKSVQERNQKQLLTTTSIVSARPCQTLKKYLVECSFKKGMDFLADSVGIDHKRIPEQYDRRKKEYLFSKIEWGDQMKIKVTIGDNDFNLLMEWSVRYALYHISQCIKLQPRASKITLVRELIEEFLEVMHVDENIRSYVTKRLKVTYVKKMQDWENMEVFYIDVESGKYKLV